MPAAPAPSDPVRAPLVPSGIKLYKPDVPDNFLATSQSLRQEHVEPNLAAVRPEVTNEGLGLMREEDEECSNKKKRKGKKPQGAKVDVEVISDPIDNLDDEEMLEEEEEGGEEEECEEDAVVEPEPAPKRTPMKGAAPKKATCKAKSVVGNAVTGKGGGKVAAKKVGKAVKGKDATALENNAAELTATAKGKARAKSSSVAKAPEAKVLPKQQAGGKGKSKAKAKAKSKAVTAPPPPADDADAEPCYDGLTYPEIMAAFLSKHKERSLWLCSDVRREAIENMDDAERKRRRL